MKLAILAGGLRSSILLLVLLVIGLCFGTARVALAQAVPGSTITLEGQFVCSQCWFEADRKTTAYGTAADLECAKDCAERHVPPAIAVKEPDGYKLFLIEEGKFKRPGENWLEYLGKQVRVVGRLRSTKEKQYLALDEFRVIGDSAVGAQEAAALGRDVELVLQDLFGVTQKLSAYREKIVVLNFWATWCIPCRKEMPDLAAIQNEYAALGVQVVGASADTLADRAKVLTFIKESRINFPVWLGSTTQDLARFGLGPGLPATAIIGRKGKILWLKNTVVTLSELKKQLDKLLSEDATAANQGIATARHDPVEASLVPS